MRAFPRSPFRILSAAVRRASAALHRAAGVCLCRVGAHDLARRHFERVLELRGDDFQSYVHLALIAYKLGDYASWQRECGHARRTNPIRYARLSHPFELFVPRDAEAGGRGLPRLPWRSGSRVSRAGAADLAGEGAGAPTCSRGVLRGFGDDFSSEAEREHFRHLDPIQRADVASTDVDELVRRLGA